MRYFEVFTDLETGKTIERDYTPEEILEVKKWEEEEKQKLVLIEQQKQNRQSALAKLAALGLTEEEIAAL